jgi:hypothetical protein
MSWMTYLPLIFFGCLVFLAILAGCVVAYALPAETIRRVGPRARRAMLICAFAILVGYFCLALLYLFSPVHLDHLEPSVVAIAHEFHDGRPVYQALDSAERHSLLYGPFTFIAYSAAMALLSPSLFSCKLLAVSSSLAFLILAFLCLRKTSGWRCGVAGSAFLAAVLAIHGGNAFWTRPDPLICSCAGIALWAALATRPAIGVAVLALSIGLGVNLKVHALFYFVYPIMLFAGRAGFRNALIAVLASFGVAVLPFFAPNISFRNWFQLVMLTRSHGIGRIELIRCLQWFLLLAPIVLFPVAVRYLKGGSRPSTGAAHWQLRPAALLLSMLAVTILGAKAGSGPWHLMPFVPLLSCESLMLWEGVELQGEPKRNLFQSVRLTAVGAYLAAAMFLGTMQGWRLSSWLSAANPVSRDVVEDVERIMKTFPGKRISMGCGGNDSEFISSHFLPLVLAQQPYFFDPGTMMDIEKAGLPLPAKSASILAERRVDVWLIPKGAEPFSMLNVYAPHRPLFPPRFRQIFLENYEPRFASKYFDLYLSRPGSPVRPPG